MQCSRCCALSILLVFDEGWRRPVCGPEDGALGPGEDGTRERQSFSCCVPCLCQTPPLCPRMLVTQHFRAPGSCLPSPLHPHLGNRKAGLTAEWPLGLRPGLGWWVWFQPSRRGGEDKG